MNAIWALIKLLRYYGDATAPPIALLLTTVRCPLDPGFGVGRQKQVFMGRAMIMDLMKRSRLSLLVMMVA